MELYLSILTYLVLVIVVTMALWLRLRIRLLSAIVVGLIFGLLYLSIIHSPPKLIGEKDPILIMIYLLVLLLTPTIVTFYALYKGIFDYRV